MVWKVGDFVLHRKMTGWGVGKVFQSNGQDISVFFVNHGKCNLPQNFPWIEMAPDALTGHPLLQNVAPGVLEDRLVFFTLEECIRRFSKIFPEGFYDTAYLAKKSGERNDKVDAANMAGELLSQTAWSDLAGQNGYGEICQRLAKVEAKTNLLHKFEKIKWQAALHESSLQKPLADALFNDLYGTGSRESRFDGLIKVLSQADGCSKWTVATYYGFLLQPEPRIFIKPEVTKFSADACGWDLQYDSTPNWNTLNRAEGMAKYLFDELTKVGRNPRDMIDIQSFIWCIEPKSYATAP